MSRPGTSDPETVPEESAPLILPDPVRVFERRAARLHALAPGHALGDYLGAMARLAEAQVVACREISRAQFAADASQASFAPTGGWLRRDPWSKALHVIIDKMRSVPLPRLSQSALSRLQDASLPSLVELAEAILAGKHGAIDLAQATFVGASLQVYSTMRASCLRPAGQHRSGDGCPVCGSPPVAGLVQSGRQLRYFICSLCASRWHLTRLVCAHCRATAALNYFAVEGFPGGTKAEACGECRTYTKLFYQEELPAVEPTADDLATLSLDLLMGEKGYTRFGVNLLFLPGGENGFTEESGPGHSHSTS